MHTRHVVDLMIASGTEVPPDTATFPADQVPGTVGECAAMAAQAEIDNGGLYDQTWPTVDDESVRQVFEKLRWMSMERHLPAFRRHAARG